MRKLMFLAVVAAAVACMTATPNLAQAQAPGNGTAYYYPTPVYNYPYGQAYYRSAPAYYGYTPTYTFSHRNLPAPTYYQYGVSNYAAPNTAWSSWGQWARMHGYAR